MLVNFCTSLDKTKGIPGDSYCCGRQLIRTDVPSEGTVGDYDEVLEGQLSQNRAMSVPLSCMVEAAKHFTGKRLSSSNRQEAMLSMVCHSVTQCALYMGAQHMHASQPVGYSLQAS